MPQLEYISPSFIVDKLNVSVDFYVDKLGFELRFMRPENDPFFAIVGRDHISIFLKEIAEDVKPIPNHTRHEWARWDAYISTLDPDDLYKEYQSKGISFHQSLKNDDDNLRGFAIEDADGYVLFFGRPNKVNSQ